MLGVAAAGVCLAVLISALSGSGGPDLATVPVSGIVTLEGQPLANVYVSFEPVLDATSSSDVSSQPGSFGITDEDGRYELEWSHGTGAIPGTHRVILVWKDPERDETEPKDLPALTSINDDEPLEEAPVFLLPEKPARDGSLRFTVPETGTNAGDFDF